MSDLLLTLSSFSFPLISSFSVFILSSQSAFFVLFWVAIIIRNEVKFYGGHLQSIPVIADTLGTVI